MSTEHLVRIWNRKDGGKTLVIPSAVRDFFEDIDFLTVSVVDGCLVYRPVTMSEATKAVQAKVTSQQPSRQKVIANA